MKSRQWLTANGIVVLVMLLSSLAGPLSGKVAATPLNNWNEFAPPLTGAADFDKDGYADLAVGVEWENVGSLADAGAVNILYGSSSGISATGDQIWDQDDLMTTDGSEEHDCFGQVLTAGDFDGDGAVDLAVGVSGEDIGTAMDAGAVHILYGSTPNGLAVTGNQLWHQVARAWKALSRPAIASGRY